MEQQERYESTGLIIIFITNELEITKSENFVQHEINKLKKLVNTYTGISC